jgi:hypothetical protein
VGFQGSVKSAKHRFSDRMRNRVPDFRSIMDKYYYYKYKVQYSERNVHFGSEDVHYFLEKGMCIFAQFGDEMCFFWTTLLLLFFLFFYFIIYLVFLCIIIIIIEILFDHYQYFIIFYLDTRLVVRSA